MVEVKGREMLYFWRCARVMFRCLLSGRQCACRPDHKRDGKEKEEGASRHESIYIYRSPASPSLPFFRFSHGLLSENKNQGLLLIVVESRSIIWRQ